MSQQSSTKQISNIELLAMKARHEKIASLTAYDASFAHILDAAGVDMVLVGDSLGMVVQGQASTVPVTIDEMAYHSKLVSRGLKRALLVTDMPFMSYSNTRDAVKNAGKLMQLGRRKNSGQRQAHRRARHTGMRPPGVAPTVGKPTRWLSRSGQR
jgi:3-methyl-2-oxobutanoate hydroxymethyltransferase